MNFYSRFTLPGSQPYLLTPEFRNNAFSSIPGTSWVPDFSMWQVNNTDFPSGEEKKPVGQTNCPRCARYKGKDGYVFWKTRDFYG